MLLQYLGSHVHSVANDLLGYLFSEMMSDRTSADGMQANNRWRAVLYDVEPPLVAYRFHRGHPSENTHPMEGDGIDATA